MKKHFLKRLLSLVLAAALCTGLAIPASAAGFSGGGSSVAFEKVDNSAVSAALPGREPFEETKEEPLYKDTDIVRVSIVLNGKSTIEVAAQRGLSVDEVSTDAQLVSYRGQLKQGQTDMAAAISAQALGGKDLDVVWNLTLAANIISANVEYGQIKAIEKVPGVEAVLIETRYEPAVVDTDEASDPNMATSSEQIGSGAAWAAGYTGAGSRVAVIDTGIDTDHQSFSADGYEYSLSLLAEKAGLTVEEYKAGLDLLDAAETADVWDQLNASTRGSYAAEATYISSKIPFGFNYVDKGLDVTHDNDTQGEHGSHVEGIAAANAYIPNGDGTFSNALDSVKVQGVAPDAQIITMKVFGKAGGAYDSDYMAAIEDAVILGADSINLSLGSGNPGMSRHSSAEYQAIMDNLTECGAVVAMSAGNSGSWVENANNIGYLYADDVSMQTNGSPGSYTNSLSVASVDNVGFTGAYLSVDGTNVFYTETTGYGNEPMVSIAGEQGYIFIDGMGTEEDWAAVGDALQGKVALCSRGEISFYQKGDYAAEAGAIATIIYNNQAGTISMDLSDYNHTQPCVSITQADGALMKAAAVPVTDDEGNVLYYEGTLTVSDGIGSIVYDSEYYTMSSFSSWGVPGSLELKPEITAPGGNIYSVNGAIAGGTAYESMSGTSMAAPQVAGMAAVVAQYIRENGLAAKTGLSARQLAQSLLMSTAEPMRDGESGGEYYPVLQQGAGLANVGAAVSAESYILMGEDATASAADGKVKAELGDDPDRNGVYSFSFSVNNLTDEDVNYALSADLFTQDLFTYYVNNDGDLGNYMDTWTIPMLYTADWTVDGKTVVTEDGSVAAMDFNGDGKVNSDDATAILEYVIGVRGSLDSAEYADQDADGDIDTYDAYLFLNRLSTGVVTVPANGSVNVAVTLSLTAEQKAELDSYIAAGYTAGNYVEGYVYVKALSTEEGKQGVSHSIPVLGFYGNWTDPSMFEVGTRAEYVTGEEVRIPYLGRMDVNTFAVTYAGDSSAYYFGGNPLVPDDVYMPERNAINSENGDQISRISFAVIRNAAASRFLAVNKTTGEVMSEDYLGAVNSAYYYTNGGQWMNTGYSLNSKFVPKGASEGDELELSLTLAPEYYVDAEGNVDWDALGEGASLSVPMVVDNTAPEIEDISVSLTGNTLDVVASDNQYVAAVALYNNAGTSIYTYAGAKQDIAAGESASYSLDLTGVSGSRFLLQVYDYALNVATYKIEMQLGEEVSLPSRIAFDLDDNQWVTFSKTSTFREVEPYAASDLTFFAASIVDHIVFASTDEGDLYVMPEDDLTDLTYVGNMGAVLTDMAYNAADGNLYGVAYGYLVAVDKLTGELSVVAPISVLTNTLACDKDGTFYCNEYGTGNIYRFELSADGLTEPELVVENIVDSDYGDPIESAYVQTMEVDPNTGTLCWNSYYSMTFMSWTFGYSYYVEIDPKTGDYTCYNDLYDEMSCLIIPEKASGGDWNAPTDEVSGIQISKETLDLLRGGFAQLTATVQPWTATDRTVTWTSSDETVAVVDANGTVTGVGVGTAVVTATSNLDSSYSASCTVTVSALDITLKGALQDEDGTALLFTWDMKNDTTWTAGPELGSKSVDSITLDTANNVLYVMDAVADSWSMHKVDPASGEVLESGPNNIGLPLWDMEYSQVFSTEEAPMVASVYYYYFLAPKDPMNLDTAAFGLSSYLSNYGASYLVAVTSLGATTYNGNDAEHFVLLDNAGNLWNFKIYLTAAGSFSAGFSVYSSNLNESFEGYGDDMYCSLVAGEDGALYLSAFTGETNNLYRLTIDDVNGHVDATFIGDVGQDVWPAALYAASLNVPSDGGDKVWASPDDADMEEIEAEVVSADELAAARWSAAGTDDSIYSTAVGLVDNSAKGSAVTTGQAPAAGSLNAVTSAGTAPARPLSDTVVESGEDVVQVNVSAKNADGEDVASTNGKLVVSYDSDVFAVKSVAVNAICSAVSQGDGSVTVAYADVDEIAAGDTVATVTLERIANGAGFVTVDHEEVNAENPGYQEEVAINYSENEDDHSETEIRGAVEATCTEEGYTGDTYCVKCGKLVKQGEAVPALGHDYGEWTVMTPATCTEDGEETRVCVHDGSHVETRVIEATGHTPVVVNASPATATENGYTGDTICSVCGELLALGRVIPATGTIPEDPTPTPPEPTPSHEDTCPSKAFVDLDVNEWYHEYTDYVIEKGIMVGVSADSFAPAVTTTRGMIMTMLARLNGVDTAGGSVWYEKGMQWAVDNGVSDGSNPEAVATREQVITMLYRYAGSPEVTGDLSGYVGGESVSDWAEAAMIWAVNSGILKGADSGLDPQADTSRVELAAIMTRFCELG